MKSRGWGFIARHERTTKNGFHYEVEYANSRFASGLNLPDPICELVPRLLAGSLEILRHEGGGQHRNEMRGNRS